MKIDLHTHILPRDWPDLDAKYGYAGFVRLDHYQPCCARMMIGDRVFREITDNVWDPKRRIEECDREKISMQVLSTVPVMFSYWAKPADALDLSRRLNDHIAEVVRDHPKRFAGLATIPMQDPDLAAGELERCVRELGLRGAQIGTHVDANPHSGRIDTLNLDNASLQPVWSAAEQLGAAIFVHPWDMLGKERMPKVLAAVARRHAGRNVAGDLLDDVRRRVRAVPETPRRLRARRRRVSHSPSAASSTRFMCGRICARRITRRIREVISLTRRHSRAVLRRLARARSRRAEVAAQTLRRATRRARLGLSVPAGRSARRQTHRIDERTFDERESATAVRNRARISWAQSLTASTQITRIQTMDKLRKSGSLTSILGVRR